MNDIFKDDYIEQYIEYMKANGVRDTYNESIKIISYPGYINDLRYKEALIQHLWNKYNGKTAHKTASQTTPKTAPKTAPETIDKEKIKAILQYQKSLYKALKDDKNPIMKKILDLKIPNY